MNPKCLEQYLIYSEHIENIGYYFLLFLSWERELTKFQSEIPSNQDSVTPDASAVQ